MEPTTTGAVPGSESVSSRSTPASRSNPTTNSYASTSGWRGSGKPGDEIDGIATSCASFALRSGISRFTVSAVDSRERTETGSSSGIGATSGERHERTQGSRSAPECYGLGGAERITRDG
jgi:hypothetical protein